MAPRRAPCFDTSVKTHTGLLLSKVTKPCIIDGLAEYGARWAEEDGFPEMAEEMEKRVGISKGIEKIIEPQAPKRSRGYEMEL